MFLAQTWKMEIKKQVPLTFYGWQPGVLETLDQCGNSLPSSKDIKNFNWRTDDISVLLDGPTSSTPLTSAPPGDHHDKKMTQFAEGSLYTHRTVKVGGKIQHIFSRTCRGMTFRFSFFPLHFRNFVTKVL